MLDSLVRLQVYGSRLLIHNETQHVIGADDLTRERLQQLAVAIGLHRMPLIP